jgi:lipoprotein-anchoring transpeptidase ErfK/SrfK
MADDWKYVGPAESPNADSQWKYVGTAPEPPPKKNISDYVYRGLDAASSALKKAKNFFSNTPDVTAESALDGAKNKTSYAPEATVLSPEPPKVATQNADKSALEVPKSATSYAPEATDYKYVAKAESKSGPPPNPDADSAFAVKKQKTGYAPEATTKIESPLDIRNLIPSVDDFKMLGNVRIQPIPLNKLQAYVGKNPDMPDKGPSLKVNLSKHDLTFYLDGTPVRTFPIAAGKPSTPSPTGKFKIIENPSEKEMKEADDYDYYHRWLGFHTIEYPPDAGPYPNEGSEPYEAYYGIHGTPNPESIGKDASHGCIRMKYSDVDQLAKLVNVNTPVIVAKDK